jgi:hypothetical protein
MRANPERYGLSGEQLAEMARLTTTAGQNIGTIAIMALATAINSEFKIVKKEAAGWRVHHVKPCAEGVGKVKGRKLQPAAVVWLQLEERQYTLLKLRVGVAGPEMAGAKLVVIEDELNGAGLKPDASPAKSEPSTGSLRSAMGLPRETAESEEAQEEGRYTEGDVYACPCGWRPSLHLRRGNGCIATVKQQAKEHWRVCRGTPPPPSRSTPGLRARIAKGNGPKNAEGNRLRAVASWKKWRQALEEREPIAAQACCVPNTDAAYGRGSGVAAGFTYVCACCGAVRHLAEMRRLPCKARKKTGIPVKEWGAIVGKAKGIATKTEAKVAMKGKAKGFDGGKVVRNKGFVVAKKAKAGETEDVGAKVMKKVH